MVWTPSSVCLEITENVVVTYIPPEPNFGSTQRSSAFTSLSTISGTGYSAISLLQTLPIDTPRSTKHSCGTEPTLAICHCARRYHDTSAEGFQPCGSRRASRPRLRQNSIGSALLPCARAFWFSRPVLGEAMRHMLSALLDYRRPAYLQLTRALSLMEVP